MPDSRPRESQLRTETKPTTNNMKHIALCIMALVGLIVNSIGAGFPDRLPIGQNGLIELLSMAKTAEIRCSAETMSPEFNQTVELGEFKSISQVEEILRQVEVQIRLQNPRDQIQLSAEIKDGSGTKLFRSTTYFSFERVGYDQYGRPTYRLPYWVGQLYFTASDLSFEFYDAEEAYVCLHNGQRYYLDVSSGEITIPGWMLGGQYDYLVIENRFGNSWYYDFRSGQALPKVVDSSEISWIGFEGFSQLTPDEEDNLNLWMAPEYGYCPWFEVTATSINLFAMSVYEYQPKFVRVATLEGRRLGEPDQILDYVEGMNLRFEEGETVFLLLEFEEWIYSSFSSNGWGEKG